MCIRLIKLKTGIDIPVHDVVACHTLSKKGSSYIIRINNRRPGSAWSVLAVGMLTGKNSVTGSNFTQDNLFLNFQLTKKKSELVSAVKDARKAKTISKYGIDQNGRVTVKVRSTSKQWKEVATRSELESLITSSSE